MREELYKERTEKMAVLNRLLEFNQPSRPVVNEAPQNLMPIQIGRKRVSWDVQRAELEAQDRIKAEKLQNRDAEIEKLEEELGVKVNG